MAVTLSLETMTTSDKLAAIEQLWDDLSKHAENVPSPDWHGGVLEARESAVQDGKSTFSDISAVKERLRKAIR